jgi:hypothetical protein
MILHRYLLRFTTFRCFDAMKMAGAPFGAVELEEMARANKVLFEKEVTAFTAADAITQLNVSEGFNGEQRPFLFFLSPLPDAPEPASLEIEEEAFCACGKVATQWRKDTPVCNDPECQRKAVER